MRSGQFRAVRALASQRTSSHRRLGPDRRHRTPRLAGFEDEALVERIPGGRKALRRRLIMTTVAANQRAGDAELYVGIQMLVVRRVDLRDHGLEAWLVDHEVEVGRPVMVAAGGADQV